MSFETLSQILREPSTIARRCHAEDDLRDIAITSLSAIVIGAAVFGGVLGSQRGDLQIVFSAVKVPLALLITLGLSVPAFHAIVAALGRPWPFRATLTLVLASLGRFALVLMAMAPVVWLVFDAGIGYHLAILVAVAGYALAFLSSLFVLGRGLGRAPGRALALLGFTAVLLGVGAQSAWALRPYLGRPSQAEVPFLRTPDGGFADAVTTSGKSAMGIYRTVDERWDGVERRNGYDGYDGYDDPGRDFETPRPATDVEHRR